MKISLFIARRLTLSADGRKSSPALKVAVISTALSVAVMLLAVSVVGGFRREIRDKVTGFDAHISLYPAMQYEGEPNLIEYTPELKQILTSEPYVSNVDPMISVPVMLKTPEAFKGLYLKGVEPDYDYSFLSSNIVAGKVPGKDSRADIVISKKAADKLAVSAGDSINLFLSSDFKARKVKVSGVYDSHFDTYDQYFAFGPASLLRDMLNLDPGLYSSIDISTTDFNQLNENNQNLIATLDKAIKSGKLHQSVKSITAVDKGAHYFAWLDLLDINVLVILILMGVVSLFTLISGMLVIILEKIQFIGVMRAIGASRAKIRRVFILLALRIGTIGMGIGTLVALALIYIQNYTHIIPLDPQAYYIDFVPVSLSPLPLIAVMAAFIIVTYLSLIIPSYFASRMKPADTLRFEM